MKNLLAANVMIAPLYLITNSLLVVGNCYAQNHPHEHRTTATVGFGLVSEHRHVPNAGQEIDFGEPVPLPNL